MPYLALFYFSALLAAIFVLVFHVKHFWGRVFVAYLAIRTAFVFWMGMPQPIQLQLDKGAAFFLIQMVVYWTLAGLKLRPFFISMTCLGAMVTVIHPGGLLGNPSINGTYLAASIALLPPTFFPVIAIAILLTWSSIAVGVLFVVAFALVVAKKGSIRLALILGPALAVIAIGLLITPDFFSSSGRFEVWRGVVPRYLNTENLLIGSGGGSYQVLGPLIQSTFKAEWLHFFMHSDWLQVLLEFGVIGLSLSIGLYAHTLKRVWEKPELFAVAAGLGAAALFNWPMHHPLTALLSVWVFRKALCR